MADQMPITYLLEKLALLGRSREHLDGADRIATDAGELDWIRLNARSIVEEIDKWRGDGVPESRLVKKELRVPIDSQGDVVLEVDS